MNDNAKKWMCVIKSGEVKRMLEWAGVAACEG